VRLLVRPRIEHLALEFRSMAYRLEQRAHKNVVAVAVANKIARIAWAVLARGEVYRSGAAVAAA